MADINVRTHVINALKPLLSKKWKVQPFNAVGEDVEATTVLLSFQSYARNPGAPRAARIATFVLTILTPKTVPGEADNALDDDLMDLLNAIDTIAGSTGLTWSTAERGVASGRPGFDITLSIPVQLDTPVQETN